MNDNPPAMLLGSSDSAERAQRLLVMPDAVFLAGSTDLAAACRAEREAHDFIEARVAALTSLRDTTGALKPHISIQLEYARMALRKVAGT